MVVVLGLAVVWLFRLRSPADPALRVSVVGMVLQLAGVLTVAIGIAQVRRRLGKPRLPESFARGIGSFAADMGNRLRRLWEYLLERWRALVRFLLRTPRVITGSANITPSSGAMSGIGTSASVGHATLTTTLEERLGMVEKRLAAHMHEIAQLRTQLAQETSARTQAISTEQSARAQADHELRQLLDDVQTGGVMLAFAGLIWLACGIVLTSIPDWLACHFLH